MPETSNIYVGNRYVPFPQGTWDESQTYYPLDMVKYQGNVYINPGPGDIAPGTTPAPNDSPWWHMYAVQDDTPAVGGGAWHSVEEYGIKPGDNISAFLNALTGIASNISNLAFPEGVYYVSPGITNIPVSVMFAPGVHISVQTSGPAVEEDAIAKLNFQANAFLLGTNIFMSSQVLVDMWPKNILAIRYDWFSMSSAAYNSAIPNSNITRTTSYPIILPTTSGLSLTIPTSFTPNYPIIIKGPTPTLFARISTLTDITSLNNPLIFENIEFRNIGIFFRNPTQNNPRVKLKNCSFTEGGEVLTILNNTSRGNIDLTIENCDIAPSRSIFFLSSAMPRSFIWTNDTIPEMSVPFATDDDYHDPMTYNIKGNWTNVNVDPGAHAASPILNLQGTYHNCIFNGNSPTNNPTFFTIGGYVEDSSSEPAGLLFSHCDMTQSAYSETIPKYLTVTEDCCVFTPLAGNPGTLPTWMASTFPIPTLEIANGGSKLLWRPTYDWARRSSTPGTISTIFVPRMVATTSVPTLYLYASDSTTPTQINLTPTITSTGITLSGTSTSLSGIKYLLLIGNFTAPNGVNLTLKYLLKIFQ